MAERIPLGDRDLVCVIDLQRDACAGGSLEVLRAESIVAAANRLLEIFPRAVLTQDWHPRGHISFASAHQGRLPYDSVPTAHGERMLWPDHCVAGRAGADFAPGLNVVRADLVLRKGRELGMDALSALLADDGRTATGLAGYLKGREVRRVFLAGVSLDFSLLDTARDARRAGFEVAVVEDAVRALDVRGSRDRAWLQLAEIGARRVLSDDLLVS